VASANQPQSNGEGLAQRFAVVVGLARIAPPIEWNEACLLTWLSGLKSR